MNSFKGSSSGAEIKINPAPFADAMALKNAILKSVSKSGINLDRLDVNKIDMNMEISSDVLNSLISAVLNVDSSDEVNRCVFKCLERCSYNSEKITLETFEDESARGDYYQIVFEVIRENINPFFKGAVSMLKQKFQTIPNIPK